MSELTRTGMSDTHLRPDLRSQNPLYAVAGSATATFELERCPYHARALADFNKSEAERRRANMAGEKKEPHRDQSSSGSHTGGSAMVESATPLPAPRPSGWVSYLVDRAIHRERMKRDHAQAIAGHELSTKDAFKASRLNHTLGRDRSRSR